MRAVRVKKVEAAGGVISSTRGRSSPALRSLVHQVGPVLAEPGAQAAAPQLASEVLEGTLTVQLGKHRHTVVAGQRAVAVPNTLHRFLNPIRETTVFITEVRPRS